MFLSKYKCCTLVCPSASVVPWCVLVQALYLGDFWWLAIKGVFWWLAVKGVFWWLAIKGVFWWLAIKGVFWWLAIKGVFWWLAIKGHHSMSLG
jgi:hypothetical protein